MARLSFEQFWPDYVLQHQRRSTRLLHLAATLCGVGLALVALWTRNGWLLLLIPVASYGLAWFSHFFLEGNRPATWQHPWLSWLADHKMCALMLTGRMEAEVERIRQRRPR